MYFSGSNSDQKSNQVKQTVVGTSLTKDEPDISLKVAEQTIRVNKQRLMDKCSYFKAMFRSDMAESTKEEIDLSATFDAPEWLDLLSNYLNDEEIQSIEEGLLWLVIGDVLSCQEMIQHGIQFAAKNLNDEQLKAFMSEKDKYHPLLNRFLVNVHKHPPIEENFSLSEFIIKYANSLLYIDDFDLNEKRRQYRSHLGVLTEKVWESDGEVLTSDYISPRRQRYDELGSFSQKDIDLNLPYASHITEILISRGILSGHQSSKEKKWHCNMLNEEKFFAFTKKVLAAEVGQATTLIYQITLHINSGFGIFPNNLQDGKRCEIKLLEEIGCVCAKYYAEGIYIIDFDLDKLRLLKDVVAQKGEQWNPAKLSKEQAASLADEMKEAFEQAQNKLLTQQCNTISTSAFALLPSKKAEQQPPTSLSEPSPISR